VDLPQPATVAESTALRDGKKPAPSVYLLSVRFLERQSGPDASYAASEVDCVVVGYFARSDAPDPLSGSPAFAVCDATASSSTFARMGPNGPYLCCSRLKPSTYGPYGVSIGFWAYGWVPPCRWQFWHARLLPAKRLAGSDTSCQATSPNPEIGPVSVGNNWACWTRPRIGSGVGAVEAVVVRDA